MSLRTKIFAHMYDQQMARAEEAGLRAMRERLLADAHGDVIEIGSGTGLNLPCYGPAVSSCSSSTCAPAIRPGGACRTG